MSRFKQGVIWFSSTDESRTKVLQTSILKEVIQWSVKCYRCLHVVVTCDNKMKNINALTVTSFHQITHELLILKAMDTIGNYSK